ncbi:hypothetical protein N8198_07505 [Gammaproteobacteria bacterium]|nr:hypothetical protein [Gammaproteobacteria bacterium]
MLTFSDIQSLSFFNKIKYVILALLFLLITFELGARLLGLGDPPIVELDAKIEYMLVPNQEYRRFGNSIRVNDYRMRSAPFELEKRSDEIRVILFGDSVVYGNHHIDQTDTIAANLEKILPGKHGKTKASVGSIAASSWGPPNILAFVERFGTFNGDIAVLVLSSHDIQDVPTFSESIIPYRTTRSLSAGHDLIQVAIERVERYFGAPETTTYDQRKTISMAALNALINRLKKDFDDVILLFHPNRKQINTCDSEAITIYRDIARSHKIKFEQLCGYYRKAQSAGIQVYADRIHLSAEGAKVLAEVIESKI